GDGLEGADLRAEAAEHAPAGIQVEAVQDLLALAVLAPMPDDLDDLRRADLGAELAGHALQVAFLVGEENGDTPGAIGEFRPGVGVELGDGGADHLPERDPHPLQDAPDRVEEGRDPRHALTLLSRPGA